MIYTYDEIIKIYQGLRAIQIAENNYKSNNGDNLFKGRIEVTFAIQKNASILEKYIVNYNKAVKNIISEYRDEDKEQENLLAEKASAAEEGREPKDVNIILREGKTLEEYTKEIEKINNTNIDIEFSKVAIGSFTDINLTSTELGNLAFMIAE